MNITCRIVINNWNIEMESSEPLEGNLKSTGMWTREKLQTSSSWHGNARDKKLDNKQEHFKSKINNGAYIRRYNPHVREEAL